MHSLAHLNLITRWVWSPLEKHPDKWLPIAFEYCMQGSVAPLYFDCKQWGGFALVKCSMMLEHLEAALQDHRLIVLADLHSQEPIPQQVAMHLGPKYNVSLRDTPRQMLIKMAVFDPRFHPDS